MTISPTQAGPIIKIFSSLFSTIAKTWNNKNSKLPDTLDFAARFTVNEPKHNGEVIGVKDYSTSFIHSPAWGVPEG